MSNNTADKAREVARQLIESEPHLHGLGELTVESIARVMVAFAAKQAAAARLAEAKLRPHDSTCEQALINPRHIHCLCGRNQRIVELERLAQQSGQTAQQLAPMRFDDDYLPVPAPSGEKETET